MKIFGKNVFNEVKTRTKDIRKIYLSKNFKDNDIINYIKDNKLPYQFIDNNVLDKMVDGHHQGIVIDINDYEYASLEEVIDSNTLVILDHLEDTHNLGAIIRTCEAAGIKGIIIPKDRSVVVNATVMKTSAGALNYVKVVMVKNLVDTINKLKDNGYFIYAADMDGKDYKTVDYAPKTCLVIGSEGNGVSALVRKNSDEIVSLPMKGHVNSLNASVAAAILIYEVITHE